MSIDIGGLAQAIVNALITSVTNLVSPLPQHFVEWLAIQFNNFGVTLWSSGVYLLATPEDITENYLPAVHLGNALHVFVPAIGGVAVILLGCRVIWRSIAGGASVLDDMFNGVLFGFILASASWIVLSGAYDMVVAASKAFSDIDYSSNFDPRHFDGIGDITNIGASFIVSIVAIVVMIFYGWKLMVRSAYRLVLLMFLTPFAPVASALIAIPQTRWVARAYWITVAGWLVGGFLAIGAISLGLQIAVHQLGGLFTLVYSVALVQLAYDLMVILPAWGFGNLTVALPHANNSALTGATAAVVGAATGAGVGAAVAGGAGAAAGASGALGTAGVGALSSGFALGPGYN